jgi:Cysteine rich repeat
MGAVSQEFARRRFQNRSRGIPMKIALRLLATAGLLSLGVVLSVTAYAQNDTMGAVLEKLTARVQGLENSCGEDIKKFCSTVTPGGGRIVYCMEAYEDKISPKCAYELDEVEVDLQTTSDQLKEAVRACQSDITKLCGQTAPGQGRIAACLAANKASVTQICVEAVEKLQVK